MDWTESMGEFLPDGRMREIYVPEADHEVWHRFWSHVRVSCPDRVFRLAGEQRPLPSDVRSVLLVRHEVEPRLTIPVSGVELVCSFASETEIVLDFLPDHVTDPGRLQALLDFMHRLGEELSHPVCMATEGDRDAQFFEYDPDDRRVTFIRKADEEWGV